MVADLIRLSEGVALAFGGGHMHQHRTLMGVGLLEDVDQTCDVMAVDRAHIGETQFLKDRAQLGDGETLHALFEVFELRRQLTVHERQVLDRLFRVVLKELQRTAMPHPVQVGRERPDGGLIDMSLSLRTTKRRVLGRWPAWLMASRAMPPVREPSPMTATLLKSSPR